MCRCKDWPQLEAPTAGVAPEGLASRFSVESLYASNYTPVGVHKPYRHLRRDALNALLDHCPPLLALIKATASESTRIDKRQHTNLSRFVSV